MIPELAERVDPVILYVLETLELISSNETLRPEVVREQLVKLFEQGEVRRLLGWELAKFALAAWADDMLISAPWAGSVWWNNNTLQHAFFQTSDGGTQFFSKAYDAREHGRSDALEVYYLCVVLGFRGVFGGDVDVHGYPEEYRLPASLEEWTKRAASAVQLGAGRPPINTTLRPLEGAPPLYGKMAMLKWAMVAVCLGAISVMAAYYLYDNT